MSNLLSHLTSSHFSTIRARLEELFEVGTESEDRSRYDISPRAGNSLMFRPELTQVACVKPLSYNETVILQPENQFLAEYEKRSDSIFRYYSVENEVDFIKKSKELSQETHEYYLKENVTRFLEEFIGKIPYTTIPYEIDHNGFSYAGLHIMSSYRRAALIGGEREKAEVDGFEKIETHFINNASDYSTAFLISPPKEWDYGFIFILEKDDLGRVKEYVIRYNEDMYSLTKSAKIFLHINGGGSLPKTADDYLRNPICTKSGGSRDNLEAILRYLDVDDRRIIEARIFEDYISSRLNLWIKKYSDIISSLSFFEPQSILYKYGIIEAKKILLTIYQQAEKLKKEAEHNSAHIQRYNSLHYEIEPLDLSLLFSNTAKIIKGELPKTEEGSCPSIIRGSSLVSGFVANFEMIISLSSGISIEKIVKENNSKDTLDCTCPYCNKKVTATIADGKITCPQCGKSAQYRC